MASTDFSKNELQRMQNDAIRRVTDMQNRARRSVAMSNMNMAQKNPNINLVQADNNIMEMSQPTADVKKEIKIDISPKKKSNTGIFSIFDKIFKDDEKTLIITLIIILLGEEDSIYSVMVLIYLLL